MVKKEIISKKINLIKYHLDRIVLKSNISLQEFLNNEDVKDIVCHNLFVVLQNIIDICNHIISDEGMEEPVYLSDMADILAKEKVIRKELIKPLKKMMGLRNLLAHQYGDIDFKVIYFIVQNELKDIYVFMEDIISYSKL
ncbi:type VII toxin-antitoxin system HepT family RNase toxin [Thermovenabulum sp.]|uniref:type VII toxin-antitoxin system HepT family RNase toxin n=1 Tax=Thermovenabulum sp. TaxID=3100335 RepID=UPI003C7EA356